MRIAIATLLAALAATSADAQPSLAEVCRDADMPTRAEYESNAIAYADNFCALATYAPQRAARQFNSMIALVRSHNNPNRFYWDPRVEPNAEQHIQLLRPWMTQEGWQNYRWFDHGGYAVGCPATNSAQPCNAAETNEVLDVITTGPGAMHAIAVMILRVDIGALPYSYQVLFFFGDVSAEDTFHSAFMTDTSSGDRRYVSLSGTYGDGTDKQHHAIALAPRIHRILDCLQNPSFRRSFSPADYCAFYDDGPVPVSEGEAEADELAVRMARLRQFQADALAARMARLRRNAVVRLGGSKPSRNRP